MSYEDYACHIIQKYRLAISIAIIKTKPDHITLDEHIQQLRAKLNYDNEEMEIDDINITINSADFKFDENDDFGTSDVNHYDNTNITDYSTRLRDKKRNSVHVDVIETQNIISKSKNNDVDVIDSQNSNDSITILQNFDINCTDARKRNSLDEVINILKDIEDTQCDSLESLPDVDLLLTDQEVNQGLINEDRNSNFQKRLEPTGTIQLLANKTELNSENKKTQLTNNKPEHDKSLRTVETKSKQDKKENTGNENNLNNIENKLRSDLKSYRHKKEFKNIYQNVANIFGKKDEILNEDIVRKTDIPVVLDNIANKTKILQNTIVKIKDVPHYSQGVIRHNIQDYTCNTHYSQSQTNDIIVIDDKYIHGKKRNKSPKNSDTNESSACKKKRDEITIIVDDMANVNKQQTVRKTTNTDTQDTEMYELSLKQPENIGERYTDNVNMNTETYTMQIYSQNYLFTQDLPNDLIPSNNYEITNQNREDKLNTSKDITNVSKSIYNYSKATNTVNVIMTEAEDAKKTNKNMKSNENNILSDESQSPDFTSILQNINEPCTSDDSMGFSNFTTHEYEKSYNDRKEISLTDDLANNFEKNINKQHNKTMNFDLQMAEATSDEIATQNIKTLEHTTKTGDRKSCANFDRHYDSKQLTDTVIDSTENVDKTKHTGQTGSCTKFDDIDVEHSDSEVEVVPYKIIEEINKIKSYLRIDKTQGYSSDAGYRSDSCSNKASFKASQSVSTSVDQSAHSLLNYLTECPLVEATDHIINEISTILGNLTDKLHEEQKYPTFLEDILDFIGRTLDLIYEGTNYGENVLLKKEEYIERVLLLNKSIHIQKYTIEKMTLKLENFHKDIASASTDYDIKNIDTIENSCYLFHLLEILLKKYNKTSRNLSQTTQNVNDDAQCLSQNTPNWQEDDKLLKKTGIMDIWRKKWNPNFKEVHNEGSSEKHCDISKCREVLNKLVVGCMENYSLISYSALKCFNVIQTDK